MMTMDERVEAAVEAFGVERWAALGLGDIRNSSEAKELASQYVREILAAAFPELHGDKPGWIAPWEATEAMLWRGRAAMRKAGLMPAYTDESANGAPPIMNFMLEEAAWPAMRDAYLGREPSP